MSNPISLQSGTVMRISLILSFSFHLITILAFPEAFTLNWAVEELHAYRVDLIRPPVEDMSPDQIPEPRVDRIKQEEPPNPAPDQDTISLDTADKRYVTYAKAIKERIRTYWRYPPEAMERLLEGKLLVVFSLAKGGDLTQINVLSNSGYEILDKEALRAIRAAAPFPPFPEHVRVSRLNIKATFDYRLTSRK